MLGKLSHIKTAIESLKRKIFPINEQIVSHLFPKGCDHIELGSVNLA